MPACRCVYQRMSSGDLVTYLDIEASRDQGQGKERENNLRSVMERWDAGTALASGQGKGCWVLK